LRLDVGEAKGSHVIDLVGFDRPFLSIMEGSKGNIAELTIRCIDNGLDIRFLQVGFQGFEEPGMKLLGGREDTRIIGALQSLTKIDDRLAEFFIRDFDGLAESEGKEVQRVCPATGDGFADLGRQ
jgi:hypothetical protein